MIDRVRISPVQIGVGDPLVFDFGCVQPSDVRVVEVMPQRVMRLGGDRECVVYRHGRIGAFVLERWTIGYEIQNLQPFPLSLFPAIYNQGPGRAVHVNVPVRIQIRNVDSRARALVLALIPLVMV
jgi:hypothetical protein